MTWPCFTGKPLPAQPPAPETLGVDRSKTPKWEVVVHVHSISLIMEKLPPVGYDLLGAGPDLGTVSSSLDHQEPECHDTDVFETDVHTCHAGFRLRCGV